MTKSLLPEHKEAPPPNPESAAFHIVLEQGPLLLHEAHLVSSFPVRTTFRENLPPQTRAAKEKQKLQ